MIKTSNCAEDIKLFQEVYCCDNCSRILGPVDTKTFLKHAKKVVSAKPLSQTGSNYKIFCDESCEKTYNNNIKEQINK